MSIRIGGIASGLDTEQMVRDLMRAERVRVDKYYRQEESIKWKQEALNTTNKTLAEFILKVRSGFGLTTTTSTGTILNKSTDSFDWVKKVNSSNESVVKATATANAMEGTHNVNVTQLAEVASVTSQDISTMLENGGFKADYHNQVLNINGKTFTIGTQEGQVKSVSELVSAINNSDLGLRAAYDSSLGKMMINTKNQGLDQEINISQGLTEQIFGSANVNEVGKNAQLTFNGEAIEKNSNNFTIFGVNYQLQSIGTSTLNVESNVDGIMDKVKGFVEEYNTLIDTLNGLVKEKSYRDYQPLTKEEKEAMSEKEIELWEERAKSGLLRNDESINRMLQSMRSGLYESVYESGLGDSGNKLAGFNHITQIGITTGNYQSGGRLEINEDKLRAAIIDNPDGVISLLFKKSSTKVVAGDKDTINQNRAESGLVERLFSDMITGMKDIVRRSGTGNESNLFRSVQSNMLIEFVTSGSISVLDRDLTSIGSRISREESMLARREDRYWNQFTAMEKALQNMNSQSSWLASQLGQMG